MSSQTNPYPLGTGELIKLTGALADFFSLLQMYSRMRFIFSTHPAFCGGTDKKQYFLLIPNL